MILDKKNLKELCSTIIHKNESYKKEWGKNLSQFLFKNKDLFFTIIQPGGNNGDKLIYKGLNKKLVDLDINYDEIKYKEDIIPKKISGFNNIFMTNLKEIYINKKTNLILIHGGGNMDDHWKNGARLLENLILHYDIPIIVAPQTFNFIKTDFLNILKKARQDIHLFCREEMSYLSLQKIGLPENINIYLSDDTAFYLNKEDFSNFSGYDTKREYALLCFRTDAEHKIPLNIVNLFKEIFMDWDLDIISEDFAINHSLEDYVCAIKGAKIVVTDRLHVSVLSSILEKPVILLPNSYFKNRAVYRYSLTHFPTTIFVDDENS